MAQTACARRALCVNPVMLSTAKHPCSLSLDAKGKRQLQRSFARPKARRAQDDRRLQLRYRGSTAVLSNYLYAGT
jgi:hypothetical protein